MKAKKTIRVMLKIEIPKIAVSGVIFKFYEFDPSPLPVLASILDSENSSASLSPPSSLLIYILCFWVNCLEKVKVEHMKAKKTIRATMQIVIPKIAISGITSKFYEFDPSPRPVLASILDSEISSASLSPPFPFRSLRFPSKHSLPSYYT